MTLPLGYTKMTISTTTEEEQMKRNNNEQTNDKDELDELIEFLSDKRADVREQASAIVAGLTGTEDGLDKLTTKTHNKQESKLVQQLLHLLGKDPKESTPSAQALINLTGHSLEICASAVNKGAVERCIDFIKDGECAPIDLLLSLLANITKTEGGVHVLSQEGKPLEGFYIQRLVQLLISGKPTEMYAQAASVLCNVSRHPIGRKVILDRSGTIINLVVPMLLSSCDIRRERIAATMQNLCCDAESRKKLLELDSEETPIIKTLLRPISGAKVNKELSDNVRRGCAGAILLLAKEENGREILKKFNAHELLKDGYELEEEADVCDALEQIGDIFLKHGMVPDDMVPKDMAAELINDEDEESSSELPPLIYGLKNASLNIVD